MYLYCWSTTNCPVIGQLMCKKRYAAHIPCILCWHRCCIHFLIQYYARFLSSRLSYPNVSCLFACCICKCLSLPASIYSLLSPFSESMDLASIPHPFCVISRAFVGALRRQLEYGDWETSEIGCSHTHSPPLTVTPSSLAHGICAPPAVNLVPAAPSLFIAVLVQTSTR